MSEAIYSGVERCGHGHPETMCRVCVARERERERVGLGVRALFAMLRPAPPHPVMEQSRSVCINIRCSVSAPCVKCRGKARMNAGRALKRAADAMREAVDEGARQAAHMVDLARRSENALDLETVRTLVALAKHPSGCTIEEARKLEAAGFACDGIGPDSVWWDGAKMVSRGDGVWHATTGRSLTLKEFTGVDAAIAYALGKSEPEWPQVGDRAMIKRTTYAGLCATVQERQGGLVVLRWDDGLENRYALDMVRKPTAEQPLATDERACRDAEARGWKRHPAADSWSRGSRMVSRVDIVNHDSAAAAFRAAEGGES